jgi:predicted acyl esterase
MPILHISGWYDDDQPGTFRNFTAMQRLGRKGQKMIVGPWPYAVTRKGTTLGILDFGPESTIDCWQTSMLIKKGHRIRVLIASAAFPKFDRNPNTGHPFGMDSEIRVARQTVLHDAKHPSHIVLPVIPAKVDK